MANAKQQLRKQLLAQRHLLTSSVQLRYSEQITNSVLKSRHFLHAKHIAFYLAVNGEVSTHSILANALAQNKVCYLPTLSDHMLQFSQIDHDSTLIKNRYNIFEPVNEITIAPEEIDLVLVPLVAFDEAGNRLGMGGGYYDQTFAFRRKTHTPILMGLAYEFQKVNSVPHSTLDVLLDEIITEQQHYIPNATKPQQK